MKIRDLEVGQRGVIRRYGDCDREYRQKLLHMGVTRGTEFTLMRKAPLGDPVEIELKDFCLTLRQHEADALEVEAL